ncbi:hypothetical protein QBC47DRAFT_442812 [Echria macrotheca]|uniref:Uncharacterized protein n=1 Tax=Echria macrotheca TaxID=438768 RepID=A0AAJ0BGD1_9PEZI|nr:hypothetical protein QBC47DRAFT_442812 [Echria macrotheca]
MSPSPPLVLTVLLSLILNVPAINAITPPAEQVTFALTNPTAPGTGPGCPSHALSPSISADRTTLTLGFDEFQLFVSPGVSVTEKSKSCVAFLGVEYPAGYTFRVSGAVFHGLARLDPFVVASFLGTYGFGGGNGTVKVNATVGDGSGGKGLNGYFTKGGDVDMTQRVWAPCGSGRKGNLTVQVGTRVSLTAMVTGREGDLGMGEDGEPARLSHQLLLEWAGC